MVGTGRWGRGGWWAEEGGGTGKVGCTEQWWAEGGGGQREMVRTRKVLGTGGAGQAIPGCFGHSHTRRLRRQPQTWERCH